MTAKRRKNYFLIKEINAKEVLKFQNEGNLRGLRTFKKALKYL